MKFLCDQMLVRLGRWLRAAGHDTVVIEHSQEDRDIMERALREERILITRDRHFLGFPEGKESVIWLQGNTVEDCVKELSQITPVNWTFSPFSRCLLCNELLQEASPDAKEQIPEDVQATSNEFRICPKCDKVYWLGSHTDRMLDKLKSWKNLYPNINS